MKKVPSRFEDLPNELITDIFKNLDARDLFRAFSQLNSRLNCLIRSFGYLRLTCHLRNSPSVKGNEEFFPFYVHTLFVDPWINFPVHRFVNVRRLFLSGPLPDLLVHLKADAMPFLEHLSVTYSYTMYEIVVLHGKIFSNTFLRLSSCELIESERLTTLQTCHICPTIEKLKFALIDANIFSMVLSHCPNLLEFHFTLLSGHMSADQTFVHGKLRRLVIELPDHEWSYDDHLLDGFFLCVPQLEHLKIHHRSYSNAMVSYLDQYDWLAELLQRRLTNLHSFHFVVTRKNDDSIFSPMQQKHHQDNFHRSHRQDRYRTRLSFLDSK